MGFGSMANDGGYLLLSHEEYLELIVKEPLAKKYLRPFLGSREFLNDIKRWCLWFSDRDIAEVVIDLRSMPLVNQRLEGVKSIRLSSNRVSTFKLASTPHLFGEIRQPKEGDYLLVPRVSSEDRNYLPIGFLSSEIICSDAAFTLPDANLYHFGVLSSSMHNAFMRLVAGRLKSDYRYSNSIVYNNLIFPFDANDDVKDKEIIGLAAQAVLDARKQYQDGSENAPTLAKLYNTYMIDPYPELTKAHTALDKAVDKAYGYKGKADDASRVEFLLKRIADM